MAPQMQTQSLPAPGWALALYCTGDNRSTYREIVVTSAATGLVFYCASLAAGQTVISQMADNRLNRKELLLAAQSMVLEHERQGQRWYASNQAWQHRTKVFRPTLH